MRADHHNLIAVNGAISAEFLFDYWAMCDEEVFCAAINRMGREFVNASPMLWIPESWLTHAHKRLPEAFYQFAHETWKNLTFEMDIGYGFPWREYTMFAAIALAIKKGARHIVIYGCDLRGEGYFTPGFENSRTRHNEKRWADEVYWFGRIQRECARHNIIIERWQNDKRENNAV